MVLQAITIDDRRYESYSCHSAPQYKIKFVQ
jgi:hypothetical protein